MLGIGNNILFQAQAVAASNGADLEYLFKDAASMAPTRGSVPLTLTRTSGAMRFNSAGNLEPLGSNVGRIDYDPDTLACRGLLYEGDSRINGVKVNNMQGLVPASTPGSGNSLVNGLPPTNWVVAKNSALTLDVLGSGVYKGVEYSDYRLYGIPTSTGRNAIYFEGASGISAIAGDTRTTSAWLQLIGGSTNNLTTFHLGGSEYDSAFTQLGLITQATPADIGTWKRRSLTRAISNATAAYWRPGVMWGAINTVDPIDITFRIGKPVDELSPFATSPIHSSGSATSRSAESLFAALVGNVYNPNEGTLIIDAIPLGNRASSSAIVQLNDGTNNNRIGMFATSGFVTQSVVSVGGVSQVSMPFVPFTAGSLFKYGLSYKRDNVQGSFNGSTLGTDTNADIPSAISQIVFGPMNMWIERFRYFRRQITLAELNARTAL